MKKNLFRIGAIALSLMLCLCGTLSVFAAAPAGTIPLADALVTGTTISVTTKDVEAKNDTEGNPVALTATAYRFIEVNIDETTGDPAAPLYKWSSQAIAGWVAANFEDYAVKDTDGNVTLTVSDNYINLVEKSDDTDAVKNTKAEAMKKFAGALSAAFKSNTLAIEATKSADFAAAGENLTANIAGLNPGSYLVLISGGKKIYSPSIANLIPTWYDADVETGDDGEPQKAGWYVKTITDLVVKAKEVDITKTVSDPKAAIGDTVTYTITADVPVYPADKINSMFVIKDTMSKGLLYTADSVKVYGVAEGVPDTLLTPDTTNDGVADEGTNYTFVYTELTDGAHTGTFTVDLTKYYDTLTAYTSIKVIYDATITADAVVGVEGNPNDATLEYSNDPYDDHSSTSKTTETKVYTYGLDLTKIEENNPETKLAGAQFEVYKVTTVDEETVKTKMSFVSEGDGKYRVALANDETGAITYVTTGSDEANGTLGKLDIRGLDVGTYELKETKAPDGYVLLNGTVSFTITDDKTAPDDKDGADGIADGENATAGKNGYVSATVENHEGFNLPLTGGMGTLLFTAGGIVLIALAAVLLFAANRKKSSRD